MILWEEGVGPAKQRVWGEFMEGEDPHAYYIVSYINCCVKILQYIPYYPEMLLFIVFFFFAVFVQSQIGRVVSPRPLRAP